MSMASLTSQVFKYTRTVREPLEFDRDPSLIEVGSLSQNRAVQIGVAGALFLTGLLVRLANLGHLALMGDEGATYVAAQAILHRGVPVLDSGLWFHRALPYTYFVALSRTLFSDLEFGLRFPSALFGALTVLCIYFFALGLFRGSLVAASLVSFVYAIHPWAVELGRFARMYSLFVLLFTTAILLFYLGFVLDIKRYRVWFSLTYILAMMVHGPTIALLALFGFRLLAKGWRSLLARDVLKHLAVLGIISISLFFLPSTLFYGNSVERPPDTVLAWGDANVVQKLSYIRLDLVSELFYALPVTSLWTILSLIILLLTLPFRQRNATITALLFLAYCILISLGSMLVWDYKINLRYIAHVLPLVLVLCFYTTADLLAHVVPPLAKKYAFVAVATGLALLLCSYPLQTLSIIQRQPGDRFYSPTRLGRVLPALFYHHDFVDYYPDLASLARFVGSQQRPGDGILLAGVPELFAPYSQLHIDYLARVPWGSEDSLAFYDTEGVARNIYTNTPYISSVQGVLDAIASYERVWFIATYSATRTRETPPSIARWLESHGEKVAFISGDGHSKVYLFFRDDFPSNPWNLARSLGDLRLSAGDRQLLWNWESEAWQSPDGVDLVKRTGNESNHLLMIHPAADEVPTAVQMRLPDYPISHLQLSLRLAPEAAAHSNGVRLSVDSIRSDSEIQRLWDKVIRGSKWTCIELNGSDLAGSQLRLVSDALGDGTFDWLTARLLIYPVSSSWALDEHACGITVSTGQETLYWTPSGYRDASGRVLVGRSGLPVQGATFPGQFHFHPDIDSGITSVEFEILKNPYARLTTTFGLADGLTAQSNGVGYHVAVSASEAESFKVLYSTKVSSNALRDESIDLSPYLNQDLHIRLDSDALGDVAYDWLQVAVRLVEP